MALDPARHGVSADPNHKFDATKFVKIGGSRRRHDLAGSQHGGMQVLYLLDLDKKKTQVGSRRPLN